MPSRRDEGIVIASVAKALQVAGSLSSRNGDTRQSCFVISYVLVELEHHL